MSGKVYKTIKYKVIWSEINIIFSQKPTNIKGLCLFNKINKFNLCEDV